MTSKRVHTVSIHARSCRSTQTHSQSQMPFILLPIGNRKRRTIRFVSAKQRQRSQKHNDFDKYVNFETDVMCATDWHLKQELLPIMTQAQMDCNRLGKKCAKSILKINHRNWLQSADRIKKRIIGSKQNHNSCENIFIHKHCTVSRFVSVCVTQIKNKFSKRKPSVGHSVIWNHQTMRMHIVNISTYTRKCACACRILLMDFLIANGLCMQRISNIARFRLNNAIFPTSIMKWIITALYALAKSFWV